MFNSHDRQSRPLDRWHPVARARRRPKPRQPVGEMQPRQALGGEDVELRDEAFGGSKISDHEMDVVRPARALEGERGAAAWAETAPHAGRGNVVGRPLAKEGDAIAGIAAGG